MLKNKTMIHYKSCAHTIGALVHVCDPCDTPEMGRVRALVLIKKGTNIAIPLVKEDWRNAIEAGNIVIIPKTIGSFDGGTPVIGDGYGNETERKLADDFILSVRDPNFADNVEFWENAEKEVWNVAFLTETKLHYAKADARLTAKAPVEEGLDTRVVWNVEIKWRSQSKPKVVDYDAIAEYIECYDVIDDSGSDSGSGSESE